MSKRNTVIGVALVAALAIPASGALAAANAQPSRVMDPVPAALNPVKIATADTSPKAAKKWARDYMKSRYGWGDAQYSALLNLWNKESSWSYKETNSSSGAYGIPQSLPAKKMASAGKDWKTNPQTQIKWGLKYIKSTYGTPTAAWAHSEANNWY